MLYGAATGIAPIAVGRDIFRGDTRSSVHLEKAHVELLWGTDNKPSSVNLSFGRQNFSLNDGFLISQFGSQWNAGPRPAVYLALRTTHDFAAIGTVKFDDWTATAFYLDANEYERLESDTVLAGGNLRYAFSDRFWVHASVIHALESKTRHAGPGGLVGTRQGWTTLATHLRWADPEVAPRAWIEAEIAHQRHDNFDMDARGGYATFGYAAMRRSAILCATCRGARASPTAIPRAAATTPIPPPKNGSIRSMRAGCRNGWRGCRSARR